MIQSKRPNYIVTYLYSQNH